MKIDGISVLHTFDRDIKYSSAMFFKAKSSRSVWDASLLCKIAIYVYYPAEVMVDLKSPSQSSEFNMLLHAANVRHDAKIESYFALGETERYHAHLWNVHEKGKTGHLNMDLELALQLACKAFNDRVTSKGMGSTLLVFGVVPRIQFHPYDLPGQCDRVDTLHSVRQHMSRHTPKLYSVL